MTTNVFDILDLHFIFWSQKIWSWQPNVSFGVFQSIMVSVHFQSNQKQWCHSWLEVNLTDAKVSYVETFVGDIYTRVQQPIILADTAEISKSCESFHYRLTMYHPKGKVRHFVISHTIPIAHIEKDPKYENCSDHFGAHHGNQNPAE